MKLKFSRILFAAAMLTALYANAQNADAKGADAKPAQAAKAEAKPAQAKKAQQDGAQQKQKKAAKKDDGAKPSAAAQTFDNDAPAPEAPVLEFEKTLVQYAPFGAFVNKFYEGDMDVETLALYGNFGFGAFNGLDGLMVANEGKFYKIEKDGAMKEADKNAKMPFALVTNFTPQISILIPANEGKGFIQSHLLDSMPSPNYPAAILIQGKFAKVITRSIPEQKPPFTTLDKAFANDEVRREFVDVFGFVVGFYVPQSLSSALPSGWHFYFINEYHDGGGQLVDFESGKLTARAEVLTRFHLIFPKSTGFFKNNFEKAAATKASSIYADK